MGKIDRAKFMEKINAIDISTKNFGGLGYVDKFQDTTLRRLRILPPKSLLVFLQENAKNATYDYVDYPWREIWVHYGVTTTIKDRVFCPKGAFKKPCPICEAVEELKASKSKKDADAAMAMLQKHRYLYLAIDRAKEDEGPKFWEVASQVHTKIVGIMQDPEYGDITDPEEGFDLKVKRTGFDFNTTDYMVNASRDTSPLLSGDEDCDWDTVFSWLDKIPNLADPVKTYSYNELEDLLDGKVTLQELRGDRQPSEVDDEDDEDEKETKVEDDEDEEEEERPRRRSRK